MDFHLNITQDVGHDVTVIFICCVFIIAAVLIDLHTGISAARKNHEKIQNRPLRSGRRCGNASVNIPNKITKWSGSIFFKKH